MNSPYAEHATVPVEPFHDLDQVLLGLADGSYVLSTPDAAVAECGTGVEALLGTPAEALAGRPTADALAPHADEEAREAFERLVRGHGAEPRAFRIVADGGEQRSLRFLVVAVPLTLGWEFTSLLGELGSRDPATWRPDALRPRHGRALEAIRAVCDGDAGFDAGGRLAGILIVVRDAEAPPLTREDVSRRMTERREAARAAEAARRAAAAAEQLDADLGDSGAEAGGLADLVERARVLRQRLEEAEREAATAADEREQALAQLAAAHAEHAAELERREENDGRAGRLAAELDQALSRAEAAEEEAAGLRHALDAAEADAAALRQELEGARADLTNARSELQATRPELEAMRAELEAMRAELEGTLAAAEGARAEREQARVRAGELLAEAAAARAAADAIRAEFFFDEPLGDTPAAASSPAPSAGTAQPLPDRRPQLPPSAPGEAIALIGLDGAFKRLDDAFCSLLGYREEQLRAARWPSVIDRENFAAHAEVARALRAGEIGSAPVETIYMHAQGLLVPVAGTVSLHRAGDDDETYFLFRADVSRTAGAL